jgi:hypothetical protein
MSAYRDDSIWLRISSAVFLSGTRNFVLAPASLIVPEIVLTLIAATTAPAWSRSGTAMPQIARIEFAIDPGITFLLDNRSGWRRAAWHR